MIGLDTTFLVQLAHEEHPSHEQAEILLKQVRLENFCLAPQVINEFIHIVTDGNRFEKPLSMEAAIDLAEKFWMAKEISHAYPDEESVSLALSWLRDFKLGRKRILDTQLAATYYQNGVRRILTSNGRDFSVFGCFEIMEV